MFISSTDVRPEHGLALDASPAAVAGTFVHQPARQRVVFGAGHRDAVPDEAARLGLGRALVVSTPEQEDDAGRLASALGARSAGTLPLARMHTPVEVTERALAQVRSRSADGLVAFGGGSAIGLAKALALRTGLPQVAVPTTYAGSEMTSILGQTEDGRKTTLRDEAVRPGVVVYDPALTATLPARLAAASGMNALAHAAEALYAHDADPVTVLLATEAIRALADALPAVVADPADADARRQALYGAWLCGTCLGAVAMGVHHRLCHVLGGTWDLPHAETHAAVLAHSIAYTAPAAPAAMARLAGALGVDDAPLGLHALRERLGLPGALADLGLPEEAVAQAARLAADGAYPNPRPLEEGPLAEHLGRALPGLSPTTTA
jgi:maleylacetate reductase